MYKFLLVVAFVALTEAKIYSDCSKSDLSTINSLTVEGCSKTPCVLKRGSKAQINIQFDSHTGSNKLTTKVYGLIGGLKVPWTGIPANACGSLNSGCPIQNGKSYEYKNAIAVLPSYPAIQVEVQFEFKNDGGGDVMCFKIPVKLQ